MSGFPPPVTVILCPPTRAPSPCYCILFKCFTRLEKTINFSEHRTTTQSGVNKKGTSELVLHAVSLQGISKTASFKGMAASRTQLLPSTCFTSLLVSLNLTPPFFKMADTKVLRSPEGTTTPSTKRTESSSVSLFDNRYPKGPSMSQGLGREELLRSQNLTEVRLMERQCIGHRKSSGDRPTRDGEVPRISNIRELLLLQVLKGQEELKFLPL